jgi:hypothetical protein
MALVTGTPLGTIDTQDEIYLEGAPNIYFQDATATPLNNPDGDGYYWGLSGTATYPVYQLSCFTDVALGEDLTINAVRCDTVGDKSAVQKRNYIELTVTVSTIFPLTVLSHILNISTPDTGLTDLEKVGIGKVNNNRYYMVYLPKVYDEDTGDYVLFHLHRAQFVDAWSIAMTSGENWNISGIRLRGYADETKPAGQLFGVIVRADPSAI